MEKYFNWNADNFFSKLTRKNKLAIANGFAFCRVSGLQGFEEALASMQNTTAFVCCENEADGYITLQNTPHTRRVKRVYMAMRYAMDDMDARRECFDIMQEVFRQFMSRLILEKTRLEENSIYLDNRITFREMPDIVMDGCACAFFDIATDIFTDLRIDENEWEPENVRVFTKQFNKCFA